MSKILIVDDEEMLVMMTRRILSTKYEVVTAGTGAAAVKLFGRERPDLVLANLMMADMDGYELHQILQEKTARTVPIIFMTSDEIEHADENDIELCAANYIRKPVKPDILLRRVGKIIDNLPGIHEFEAAASTDPTTKLLNKSAAQRKLAELVKKFSGALMIFDVDNFKTVNDLYGHAAGDKILIRFADLIKSVIRSTDLAGRIGGDKFIAFLQNADNEKILRSKVAYLNEQILIAAQDLFGTSSNIPLSVSVGAVFVPDAGNDFAALCQKADSALCTVKHAGKCGLEIFGNQTPSQKSSPENISQMRRTLSERKVAAGAYFVRFEIFKNIYRLLTRMADGYKKGLVLMQFTLPDENFADFKEILIRSLRQSDCVTRNGQKFFVLLMNATELEALSVRDRIFSRLKTIPTSTIEFECEKIF